MKYVLDLKDKVTKLNPGEKDTNETFYRYLITTDSDKPLMTVWFSQSESGDIYSVYCRPEIEKLSYFDIYFDVPLNDPFKPSGWHCRLKSADISNETFDKIHSGMQMLRYVCNLTMQIFDDKEHIR